MQPIIYTQNLNKVFKVGETEVHALNDVSINVYPGVLTMLRGRSGSGKTTLMNLLGALDKPTDGKIFFEDIEISQLTESGGDNLRRSKVGFVFQSVALISLMTAYENVELGLRIAKYKGNRRKRAEECLALVGLKERMTHRPAELSGGEQQRVAIARAIAHRPTVIFADEPTAELDTHMSWQVMRLLQDLVHKEGLTAVVTTHDPNMMDLADHVYSLADGVVVDEVWNIPHPMAGDLYRPREGEELLQENDYPQAEVQVPPEEEEQPEQQETAKVRIDAVWHKVKAVCAGAAAKIKAAAGGVIAKLRQILTQGRRSK